MEENFLQRMTISAKQIEAEKKEQAANKMILNEEFPLNQKFALLEALVKENDIADFLKAFKLTEKCFDLAIFSRLLNAILEYIEWLVEPCYRHLSPTLISKRVPKISPYPLEKKYQNKELRHGVFNVKNIFESTENV
jgi:hypothetical protein